MALARLALKNLSQRVSSTSSSLVGHRGLGEGNLVQRQKFGDEFLRSFMVTKASAKASDEKSEGKEVAVSKGGRKSSLLPWKRGRKGRGLWRNDRDDYVPALYGLGNALMQATENINSLFDNLNITPSKLMARLKVQDECYKIRYDVPGLTKEDLKIIIEDGVLTIKGEHKEKEEEGSDDEFWSASSSYFNTSFVLPDDTKVDEIKAELKDGVLTVIIPRTEEPKKDVKEVKTD